MFPFTTSSAPHFLFFFVRASVANKRNSIAEVRGFGDQCVCVRCPGLLAVFIKTDDWLRF